MKKAFMCINLFFMNIWRYFCISTGMKSSFWFKPLCTESISTCIRIRSLLIMDEIKRDHCEKLFFPLHSPSIWLVKREQFLILLSSPYEANFWLDTSELMNQRGSDWSSTRKFSLQFFTFFMTFFRYYMMSIWYL